MNNVKIPGVLWIVLIVAVVALAHYYLDDPFVVDMIVIVAGMVLKSLKLGTAEENQAIDIINMIKQHPRLNRPVTVSKSDPDVQMRGPSGVEGRISVTSEGMLVEEPPVFPDPPPRPNKMLRWLVG